MLTAGGGPIPGIESEDALALAVAWKGTRQAMDSLNVLLIGCGQHGPKAHLNGIATFERETGVRVNRFIGDVRPRDQLDIAPADRDRCSLIQLERSEPAALTTLSNAHADYRFDACIVSTPPAFHRLYAEWALKKGCHVLVDKPLTFPDGAHHSADRAAAIVTDFQYLKGLWVESNSTRHSRGAGPLHFQLGAQKRYQVVYQKLGGLIRTLHARTGCPVTNVVCCTGDGWWPGSDSYDVRLSYKRGGKLIHTGFHFLDIIPWLVRHAPQPITHGWVVATAFRPADALAAYGARTRASDNGDPLARSLDPADPEEFERLGDINSNLMVRLCDREGHQRVCILFSFLHEGLSLRKSKEERGVHRTKSDYLSITQGPLMWIELRRIAKFGGAGNALGGPEHQALAVLCNPRAARLTGRNEIDVSDETMEAANSGPGTDACINDEAPTIDFLKHVSGLRTSPSLPSMEDHIIGVRLLSAAYESAAVARNDGEPKAVRVPLEGEWTLPPGVE